MDLSIFVQYSPILIRGFGVTVFAWLFGTVLGMALGLVIALAQRYGPRPLRWLIQVYVEVIRNTPFLVQLFIIFFGLPPLGLRLSAPEAALLAEPAEAVRKSVRGMLPKGPLGRQQITKLQVYAGPTHPHAAQTPKTLVVAGAKAR